MLPRFTPTAEGGDESPMTAPIAQVQQQVVTRRRTRYRSRNCANLRIARRRRLGPRRPRDAATQESAVGEIVGELERRRSLLTSLMVNSRMHSLNHVIRVVESFYLLLENGYSPTRIPQASRTAELFLRSNMSHDVEWTTMRGVDIFLQHHQLYSESHASIHVSVYDISQDQEVPAEEGAFTLNARGIARFRISRDTLAQFFPSVLEDEFLAQEFIGQEYSVEYCKVFRFRQGLITSHGPFVDVGGAPRLIHSPSSFEQHVRRSLASTYNALQTVDE